MNDVVLDASALLALLKGEPGADTVKAALQRSSISAVNLAEVVSKLSDGGMPDASIRSAIGAFSLRVEPFNEEQAYSAGFMRSATRNLGLSLGDRSCLGLALNKNIPVLTADRSWAKLSVGVQVQMVR